jgi:type 1 glutamine amidotransferase
MARFWLGLALIVAGQSAGPVARLAPDGPQDPRPLRVLFLGHDRTHHPSAKLMPMLARTLARKGIQLTYVMTPAEALDPATLRHYDALMIYANHETMTPAEEQSLVAFVESGKGLVAIHSASAMFKGSARYIAMVGGQFARHGAGEFAAEIVLPDHPIVRGLEPFSTWDETYVHTRHNADGRTVLMERVDADGREPYTWVRTEGRGRVFYTAFGHDERVVARESSAGDAGLRRYADLLLAGALGDLRPQLVGLRIVKEQRRAFGAEQLGRRRHDPGARRQRLIGQFPGRQGGGHFGTFSSIFQDVTEQ